MPPEKKPVSLQELYVFLKPFSLSDSLFVIGVINAALRYGYKKVQVDGIPQPVIEWLKCHGKETQDLVALSLHLSRLARFLILSGTDDYKEPVLDVNTPQLLRAINLVSELWDKEADGEIRDIHDVSAAFGRIGQWQFPLQGNRTDLMGRAYQLFIAIPKEISCKYDLDRKMQEYFGLSTFQFVASGIALWIMTIGVLKHNLTIEVGALKDYISTESIKIFVKLSSGTAEDYRRYIRGEEWKKSNNLYDIYGLDPFMFMPAIRIQYSRVNTESECYMVPQPFYLLQRASLGIFYLLADKERDIAIAEGHTERNEFRDVFGGIYRKYVDKNLSLSTKKSIRVIDLDNEVLEIPDIKKPDFALIEGGNCVLFEIKTAPFSVSSRTVLDKVKAEEELKRGSFKKAMDQLNSFEQAIFEGRVEDDRFDGISKVVKVVVLFEDIYLANAFLLPIARKVYGKLADNLQIACITDIEVMGRSLAQESNIIERLIEKIQGERRAEEALTPFFSRGTKGDNPLLKKSYEDLMAQMAGSESLPF